jgi:hypothetical protein
MYGVIRQRFLDLPRHLFVGQMLLRRDNHFLERSLGPLACRVRPEFLRRRRFELVVRTEATHARI